MFLQKAMRYYRLWIYTCNAVLFAAVVVLVVVAAHTATQPYYPLLPGPPAYDPTYLYAYIALFLQAGIIQAVGCFGALRLSQRLLHIYWTLLFVLLMGDLIVGLVWFLRFPKLSVEINASMNSSFHVYGQKEWSSEAWDSLQTYEQCCGIRSPDDYGATRWGQNVGAVPASCCIPRGARAVQADQAARHVPLHHTVARSERPARYKKNFTCARSDHRPFQVGCEEALRNWMYSVAETLMIIGFCVITFIKFCFVGILRFEIQEMIEKIKVLQGDSANTANPELAAALGLVLPGPQGEPDLLGDGPENNSGNNGGRGVRQDESEDHEDVGITESRLHSEFPGNGSNSIGIREDPRSKTDISESSISPLATMRVNLLHSTTTDAGGDSDTNSHSALITDTPVHRVKPNIADKTRPNGNNNEVTTVNELPLRHLFHVRQTEI